MRFDGDELLLPSHANIGLATRSKVSFRVSARRVRSGRRLKLSGSVANRGEWISAKGLQMRVEIVGSGLSYNSDATIDKNYRFSLTIKAIKTRRPLRMRLRAVVPARAPWPYERGVSPTRRITIVP